MTTRAHRLPLEHTISGTGSWAMSLRPPEPDDDPERYPIGRWSGEEADEYAGAVAVISHVVMLCTKALWEELRKPEPERDQERFAYFNDVQTRAWRERRSLDLKDHDKVAWVIGTYTALGDELERRR